MMPDLGKYAASVLSAYAVSVVLLAGLIGWVWLRSRQTRQALDEAEARARNET
jgi:heme exporter protein D